VAQLSSPTTDAMRRAVGPVVRADDVSLVRGGVWVLDGVTVRLDAGQVALCRGPNGAGKTSLLRVLAGLVRPTAGSVTLAVRQVDLVGHEPALHPDLTLAENLQVVAALTGRDHRDVDAALTHVGLGGAGGRRAARCSTGMRRRAEFARLRLTRPCLLLLDEPAVALDGDARVLVQDAITATVRRGGSVVVATHAPGPLADLATARWTVRDGSVTT